MLLLTLFDLPCRRLRLHFVKLVSVHIGFAHYLTFSQLSYLVQTHHLLHLFLAHVLVHFPEFGSVVLVLLLFFVFLGVRHLLLGQTVFSQFHPDFSDVCLRFVVIVAHSFQRLQVWTLLVVPLYFVHVPWVLVHLHVSVHELQALSFIFNLSVSGQLLSQKSVVLQVEGVH